MLTHIVCWKYRSDVVEAERQVHRAKLAALAGIVPEVIDLKVGADILDLERSFDTGLVATFADRDALDRYTHHAEHQKVAALGRDLSERVVSVDFTD